MSWLSGILKGVGTYALTGSAAGAATSFFSDSFLAGTGVGMLDNLTGRSLSYGAASVWNGNYGYGNFYGNSYNYNQYGLGYGGFNMYQNYGNMYGNAWGW